MSTILKQIFFFTIFSVSTTFANGKKPTIIFILMDNIGYSDITCYGATKLNTPNFDRLAAKGMQFTDFHSTASSPSRTVFFTGTYPQRCGLYMGISPKREAHWLQGLDLDEITIAEQTKSLGYNTSIIMGKWHLESQEEFSYYHQGFDHYYGASKNMKAKPQIKLLSSI